MDFSEAVARIHIALSTRSWLQSPDRTRVRPSRLFHYTSQVGLLGIVTSNVLWATNALYLNDSSELTYGLSIAREKINAVVAKSDLLGEFLRRADRLLDLSCLVPNRDFYACCFCEGADLLSQWRGYSDSGGGYAIGFDTEDLGRAGSKQHMSLFPVEYGAGPSAELLAHDLKVLCDSLECCARQFPGSEERLISAACEHLRLMLVFRTLSLKHPGFEEEREWRILANFDSTDPARLRFRKGQTTLVPYVELGISDLGGSNDKLLIREVVHGPSTNSRLASESLISLFKKHGFNQPQIRSSTIPLRTP